eukprot:gene9268-6516_t
MEGWTTSSDGLKVRWILCRACGTEKKYLCLSVYFSFQDPQRFATVHIFFSTFFFFCITTPNSQLQLFCGNAFTLFIYL